MCAACRSFSLDPADKLTEFGFGRCALLPAYQYRSRRAPCIFEPSRFVERAP
jgi:hypothetical protein